MFALYIPPYVDRRIRDGIADHLILKSNESESFASFQDNRDPDSPRTHLRIFVFHLVNPAEVIRGTISYAHYYCHIDTLPGFSLCLCCR
jgi:hypothetical protein